MDKSAIRAEIQAKLLGTPIPESAKSSIAGSSDDSSKQKLLDSFINPKLTEVISTPTPIEEDNVYKYRNCLQKIHTFEKKISIDSEDWGDEEWQKFESWLKPKTTEGLLEQVFEKKTEGENQLLVEKKKIREQAFSAINFDLIGGILK